jgi:hypothetical protein
MNSYTEQRAMLARMVRARDETRRHIEIIRRQIEKRAERMTITARNKTCQYGRMKSTWTRADECRFQQNAYIVRRNGHRHVFAWPFAGDLYCAVLLRCHGNALRLHHRSRLYQRWHRRPVRGHGCLRLFAYFYATLRSPGWRLALALIFAVPAAIAGFAREAVLSEVWRKIFSLIGGAFVGLSALERLREAGSS